MRFRIFPRLIIITIVVISVALLFSCTPVGPQTTVNITLSQAIALSKTGNIKSAHLDTDSGSITLTPSLGGKELKINDTSGTLTTITNDTILVADSDSLNLANLQALGFVLPEDYSTNASSSAQSTLWTALIPLLLLGAFVFLLLRAGRSAPSQGVAFSRTRQHLAPIERSSITFADVAGVDEAKQDLQEVVGFLKNRAKFQQLGARIPKGVLLIGPPGTGKTLLARAIAGEAGVPFFSISGSEFVELYVGVGAARVRELFDQAKKNAPCIVFIDEIDAVGRRRGSGLATHEEREQTLNQILTEMDGFNPNSGVIVLAATNRPDVLDPALLRPGRFDRRIVLDRPDVNGRLAILKVHTTGKPLEASVDLEVLAKETHGFSGADLANLVNEAAILATRREKSAIGMKELEESIDRVIAGPERKSIKINARDKEITAYHEAGHALVAYTLPNADPVHKISIVARGGMGGYTRLLTEDRYIMTRSQFNDTLATYLAGHASEEMIFNEVSTGPHNDIKQATSLARQMITEYGMGKSLPLRTFGGTEQPEYPVGNRDYGEEIARQIDVEVHQLIDNAHLTAKKVLQEKKARLIHLAEKLMVVETLEGQELTAAFTEPIPEAELQKATAPAKS